MSMTVTDAISTSYLLATGKPTAPSSGTSKYNRILGLLNVFSRGWANEPGVDWQSLRLWANVTGTVTATATFAIPTTLDRVSKDANDPVRILHSDGITESEYTIVPAERLYESGSRVRGASGGTVAIVGSNLVFDTAFTADSPQFGGTIQVPGYKVVATLSSGSDAIEVDDPDWLCYMVAAEYVRNDITRVQQYGNLVALANNAMNGMKEANGSAQEQVTAQWSPLGSTWE